MSAIAAVIGRILLALLFLYSGAMKLMNSAAAEGMLGQVGLPPQLAVPVGIFEVVAALCLILGLMTRLAAFLLAVYVLLTIFFFHHDFGNFEGMIAALTHLALVGGLLVVFAYGQMRWSYDHIRASRRGELAAAKAEERAHEAELRAARAEGKAEVATTRVVDRDRDGHIG
jgi:putative oxidoreductase